MNSKSKFKWFEIIGIIVCFLLAVLFHFLFELSGNNSFVAVFTPTNESVFEHSKILIFPFIIYSIIELLFLDIDIKRFLTVKSISLILLPILMTAFFYTYSGIIGGNLPIVDIISTLIHFVVVFLISYHLYYSEFNIEKYFILFSILAVLVIIFTVLFTYMPPKIPFFRDSQTGKFGF